MPIDAQPIATFGSLEGIIPVGATTFTLTFGPYTDALGVNLSGTFSGKLYPVDQVTGKRTKVVHLASGQVILPQDVPITVTAGTASVGPLPHTGQASMTPFFYRVEWALTSGKPSPGNKTFAAPAASGSTIDFDLLDTSATPGVWVSPAVVSVNGQTGAVVLDAADVGADPAGAAAAVVDNSTSFPTADKVVYRRNAAGRSRSDFDIVGLTDAPTAADHATRKDYVDTGLAGKADAADPRLTNARTPTTHASTHASGGSDPVTPAAIGADAAGAATAAQAFAIQRANHTGTQSADTLTDGTTNKAFLATERTKLSGIATGATANATDAQLRDRSTHTGTQAATTITGLATVATSGLKADVGLGNVDNTSDAVKPVSTAQQTALDAKAPLDPNRLAVGESTLPRYVLTGAALAAVSGQIKLTYFTAQTTETVANVRSFTGGTAAAATPTLCRIGIYSVAGNGDLVLVGSTANDTTLWNAANSVFTRALSASFTKTAGQRYAIGQLIVTAAALPNWPGTTFNASTEWTTITPRLSAALSGQTDLPSSITSASVGALAQMLYVAVTP